MATKCCLGGNECNHIVSIGYLKDFVNVPSDGIIVSVNSQDNTYCPTYGELTGGTLVANHIEGQTPNGDIDGIVVSGSYNDNQVVNQEDLSLIYTRFKSLSISASKTTNLDACGDTSALSYANTYTRYTRAITNDCETVDDPFDAVNITSLDVSDTADNEVSWVIADTANGSISYPTYSISKNGDGSTITSSRYDDITAAIIFRGTTHSSNTIRITQNGLNGNFEKWYSDYTEYYSYDNYVISPSSFNCDGGSWTGTGYYTRHDWWVYRWKDECNIYHDDVTTTGDDAYTNKTEEYETGAVQAVDCSTLVNHYYNSGDSTYHGITANWEQNCDPCSNCDSVSLSPLTMSWNYDSTSEQTSTYVVNAASVNNFSVSCTDTTNFTVTHDSTNKTITVKPNSQNIALVARMATITLSYDTVSQNGCTKTISLAQGTQACDCGGLIVDTTTISWDYNDASQKSKSYAMSNCITDVMASSDNAWFSVDYATAGQIKVTPNGTNATLTAKTGTITVSYDAHNGESVTHCSSSFTVTQGVESCDCNSVNISPVSLSWAWSDSSSNSKDITISSAICISNITITGGDLTHFNATVGANKVTVAPKAQNTTTVDNTGTLNINYSFGSPVSSCTKTVSLLQGNQGCGCTALTMSDSSMSWNDSETSSTTRAYTIVDPECISNVTVSTGGTNGNRFNVSLDTVNSTVTVTPIGPNETLNDYNGIVTLTYTVNGVGACTISFNVIHKGVVCGCNDFSIDTSDMLLGCFDSGGTRTFTLGLCNAIGTVTSNNNWFTTSVNGNTITVSTSGTNDESSSKQATITVNFTASGGACTAKTFNVIQASCNPCDYISGLPDSINFTAN